MLVFPYVHQIRIENPLLFHLCSYQDGW